MSKNTLVTEGKTKKIWREPAGTALIASESDITAGDGKKHDILAGKAELSTRTTCNVFEFLKESGISTSFIEPVDETSFRAELCTMIQLEVVVRGEAHGSYLKRFPNLEKGYSLEPPLAEFYLKTSGKAWKDLKLPCDDPLAQFNFTEGSILLSEPNKPKTEPFASIPISDVLQKDEAHRLLEQMGRQALEAFIKLRKRWDALGLHLVDFKIEFGIGPRGIVIADVIDNDSWRLLKDGEYMDKQVYRDGKVDAKLLAKVYKNYKKIAELSEQL